MLPQHVWLCTHCSSAIPAAQDVARRPEGPPAKFVNPLNIGKLLGVSGWGFTKRNEVRQGTRMGAQLRVGHGRDAGVRRCARPVTGMDLSSSWCQ